MKKLEAIIRKSKFKEVKSTLMDNGFNSFNYHLTRCISEQTEKRFYRGVEFESKATERVLLSIYATDKNVDAVVKIIRDSGRTGAADDSYLAIFPASKFYKLEGGDEDKLIEII